MSAPCVSSRISASAALRLRLSRNASPTSQHRVRHISNCTSTPLASATFPAWKSHRTSPLQHTALSSSSTWLPTFARSRRRFSTTPISQHGHLDTPKPGEERKVTFIDKEGDSHTFEVADGGNLLDIAQANDLEMEGACGGSCACSTCHVIVDSDHFDIMEEPEDDENDMLDLAFGLTETSRLGCQIVMSKELDGLVVKLPKMTRNLQASDFESK
ncbi:ferredoxin [Mytilinidion resinicola]|uniref:Ferredoxin n=1 Tax=Mytilinidion resinicola TaxID=574789 RepID=A0A6A6Z7H2_9PEZI|nr:ferredoxin [Mytilinidion resinicola]KAF2816205.1 ferredoxin [Mytilinidion resinicola]